MSFAGLNFKSHNVKSAQLTLTPHHLFYLLSRIEELDVNVGPMNVRIESIHNESSPANYISFLQTHNTSRGRSDVDSIHSVSSVRSVMSGMSALWSSMGLFAGSSKSEKARLALANDLKYTYGAFTKLPSLRLTPDHRTPMIKGYEQFPFDTAVPLFAFKNLQQLEIVDLDFRNFHGWDRLAEQLCLLTIKRGNVDDPLDLLEHIVLDDAEKRRKKSNRSQAAPSTPSWSMPSTPRADYAQSHSDPGSPPHSSPSISPVIKAQKDDYVSDTTPMKPKVRSQTFVGGASPRRPTPARPATSYRHQRTYSYKAKRSGSGSSNGAEYATTPSRSEIATANVLPQAKWQRLVYLSLTDNAMTSLPLRSIQSVAPSLRSFNLSSNLFAEIPESLASLTRLVSLDLSNCMIESLQTFTTHPLLALTTLKLKSNRLQSLAGIEQLSFLENLHIQDNRISDPDEVIRLTQLPNLRKLWIKHNPMCKRCPQYRIVTMNHWRASGQQEDIVIDDQPATYSERKQLIDRVTSSDRSPPRQEAAEGKVILVQESRANAPVTEASARLSAVSVHRQLSAASTRRKRGPKRRIVDITTDDATLTQESVFNDAIPIFKEPTKASNNQKTLLTANDKFEVPALSSSPEPSLDDVAGTPTNLSPNGEEYKRKVEELRLKLGNTWLSALGEQHSSWQSDTDLPSLSSTHPPPPRLHHYHSTPPAVGVGGNLL